MTTVEHLLSAKLIAGTVRKVIDAHPEMEARLIEDALIAAIYQAASTDPREKNLTQLCAAIYQSRTVQRHLPPWE